MGVLAMPWPVADGQLPLTDDYNDVMVDGNEWKEWPPRLSGDGGATELNLGTGSIQVGRIYRFGIFTVVDMFFKFGSSGATFGNGVYRVSPDIRAPGIPGPLWSAGDMLDAVVCGGGTLFDASTGVHYAIMPHVDGGNWQFVCEAAGGSWVSYNIPFLWAANDYLMFWAIYEREFHS